MNHNFKELKIWQKGIEVVDLCYDFAGTLPKKKSIISQITRCACSIPLTLLKVAEKEHQIILRNFYLLR